MFDGVEREVLLCWRIGGRRLYGMPFIDLILFQISVEEVLILIELVYFCHDSVLFF